MFERFDPKQNMALVHHYITSMVDPAFDNLPYMYVRHHFLCRYESGIAVIYRNKCTEPLAYLIYAPRDPVVCFIR